jgi:hypothetical protein
MWHWKRSAMVGLLIFGSLMASRLQGEARLDPRRMPPSTQPRASKFPLPPAFAILTQHSLFARNGIAINAPDIAMAKPEASMALRGIAMDETSFIAFIEDTIAHRTLTLRAGDGVAGGRIRMLDLDELAYEVGSNVTHVRVGQNLLGGILPPVVMAPPPAPTGPAGPPNMPPGAEPAGPGDMPPNPVRMGGPMKPAPAPG